MYEAGGRPSPAKFRSRLTRILEAAHTGRVLAERWNPKGRNYQAMRELIEFYTHAEAESERLLALLNRGR